VLCYLFSYIEYFCPALEKKALDKAASVFRAIVNRSRVYPPLAGLSASGGLARRLSCPPSLWRACPPSLWRACPLTISWPHHSQEREFTIEARLKFISCFRTSAPSRSFQLEVIQPSQQNLLPNQKMRPFALSLHC